MDSIDSQWVGIHHDQPDVGFVAANDEQLHALRAFVYIVHHIEELLLGLFDRVRIDRSELFAIPLIEIVTAVPALDRNQRGFWEGGRSGRMGHRLAR